VSSGTVSGPWACFGRQDVLSVTFMGLQRSKVNNIIIGHLLGELMKSLLEAQRDCYINSFHKGQASVQNNFTVSILN
jgi:hypothetical protein